MGDDTEPETATCARCGTAFPFEEPHTALTRRDFVERPRPASIEYLCLGCWRTYVEEFLGESFTEPVDFD